MIEVRHVTKKISGKYRCIVISDIHSHLDRFIDLLNKVNYCHEDYLVILGDFIEKGTQALEIVAFLQELQAKSDRVFVLLGNCEYAIEKIVTNKEYASHVTHYLNHVGKGGLIRQALANLKIDYHQANALQLQQLVADYLEPCFNYFRTLPTTLHLNNFIFVHAGIENRPDWQNSNWHSFIEMRTFYQDGHCLDDYVVVGHLPTSNQFQNRIDNNIIIDDTKRIICIDGGTGVKSISQLNALIIEGNGNHFNLTTDYVQPLPLYQVIVNIKASEQEPHKIAWPNFEVKIIKQGKNFTLCQQLNTNQKIKIKNEFLYSKNDKIYCLDDYVDLMLTLSKGQIVKLIGIFGPYAYVIKDNEIGWVRYRYLKRLKKK